MVCSYESLKLFSLYTDALGVKRNKLKKSFIWFEDKSKTSEMSL